MKFFFFLTLLFTCSFTLTALQVQAQQFDPVFDSSEFKVKKRNLKADFLLSLDDCVKMALLNNREIRAADYSIEAAKWRVNEAKARGIPVINYQVDIGPAPKNTDELWESVSNLDLTFFSRFKVEIGVPLYSFGKLNLAKSLALEGVAAERMRKIEKENEVVLKVKKLYSGILLARELIKLLGEAESHLSAEIKRKSEDQGPIDQIAVTKLKLFRFELTRRLHEATGKEKLAQQGLRILLGVSNRYSFELKEKYLKPVNFKFRSFDDYLRSSQRNNPKQRLLNVGLRVKEKLYRLEKRKLAPDIGVGGFIDARVTSGEVIGEDKTELDTIRGGLGFRIQGELNIKGQRAKIKRAQAEYYSALLKKNIAKQALELELKKDFESVSRNKKELRDTNKGRRLAQQLVFLTKSNLDVGVGQPEEYAKALEQYMIMKGRYLESIFNFNSAVAEFEAKFESARQYIETK